VSDPVSWLVVEAGWRVVASDGSDVGSVQSVVGDTGKDIFNGLAVSPGLLKAAKYVPAERVATITEGQVELSLSSDEFEALDRYEETPPSAEILPPDRRDG
jgi:uncharacterized protein YrrD